MMTQSELDKLSEELSKQNREALAESWLDLLKFHGLTDDANGDKALMGILRKHVSEHLGSLGVAEDTIERIFSLVFPSPVRDANGERIFI